VELDTQLKLSEFEQGFLVGLIEGEGCLSLTKCKNRRVDGQRYINYVPRLSITNTSYELLVRTKNIVRRELGIGRISKKPKQKQQWKQGYAFEVGGLKLLRLLRLLQPKLISKRRQAQILLQWCQRRTLEQSRKYTEDDFYLVRQMKRTNKEGAGYIG